MILPVSGVNLLGRTNHFFPPAPSFRFILVTSLSLPLPRCKFRGLRPERSNLLGHDNGSPRQRRSDHDLELCLASFFLANPQPRTSFHLPLPFSFNLHHPVLCPARLLLAPAANAARPTTTPPLLTTPRSWVKKSRSTLTLSRSPASSPRSRSSTRRPPETLRRCPDCDHIAS